MTAERSWSQDEHAADLESLSCMADGELDAAQCERWIARLAQDGAARDQWTLMHLAGDALRSSEVACWHARDFSARVAAAIAREPAIVAPGLAARRRRLLRRVVLPGVAVSAAAAVLVVAVMPLLQGRSDAPVLQAAKSSPPMKPAVSTAGGEIIERSAHMEAYLAAHREVSGAGMMPPSAPLLRASTTLSDEARQ